MKHELIVVGAGTGGYVAACGALRLGWRNVVLIDKSDRVGGTGLHTGCVPSKMLMHVAQTAKNIRQAARYGLESYLLNVDFAKISAYIQQQVADLAWRETQEAHNIFKQLGGKIVQGKAQIIDPNSVQVSDQSFSADHIVLATGSRPIYPEIKGLDQRDYFTNENLLTMPHLPKRLAVVGNNAQALEFAQAFALLGSSVCLLVDSENILPHEDQELTDLLQHLLLQSGIEIYVNSQITSVHNYKDQKVLECMHARGQSFTVEVDAILIAEGRRPNIEELALESAGVAYTEHGIVVNNQMQSSQTHIYAVGDVAATPYKLSHAAEYQANIVLSHMILRQQHRANYHGIPYVIFTDPEYAQVGLSERQAYAQGLKDLIITRFDFADLDGAMIKHTNQGRIKIISHNGKIIGANILGADAGNLLAEWGLAIKLGASVADVAEMLHAYPTLAQINRRVANKYMRKLAQGKRASKEWMQRMLSWA